jgi:hypothetical protein
MTDEPADPRRPDNLFEAPATDVGSHGRFDESAGSRAFSVGSGTARALLLGAGLGVFLASLSLAARRDGRDRRALRRLQD